MGRNGTRAHRRSRSSHRRRAPPALIYRGRISRVETRGDRPCDTALRTQWGPRCFSSTSYRLVVRARRPRQIYGGGTIGGAGLGADGRGALGTQHAPCDFNGQSVPLAHPPRPARRSTCRHRGSRADRVVARRSVFRRDRLRPARDADRVRARKSAWRARGCRSHAARRVRPYLRDRAPSARRECQPTPPHRRRRCGCRVDERAPRLDAGYHEFVVSGLRIRRVRRGAARLRAHRRTPLRVSRYAGRATAFARQ